MRFGRRPWVSTAELNQRSATAGMALSGLRGGAGTGALERHDVAPAVVAALGVLRLGRCSCRSSPGYPGEVAYVPPRPAACASSRGRGPGLGGERPLATQVLDLSSRPGSAPVAALGISPLSTARPR